MRSTPQSRTSSPLSHYAPLIHHQNSSSTGIVNIYDPSSAVTEQGAERKALRAVGNLTTAVTSMRFNHDSQILALASKTNKDQLKLVSLSPYCLFYLPSALYPRTNNSDENENRSIYQQLPSSPTGQPKLHHSITSPLSISPKDQNISPSEMREEKYCFIPSSNFRINVVES